MNKLYFGMASILVILFLSIAPFFVYGQEWNKGLSPQQKIYTLSKVWKDVSENFAFFENVPDLNWDSLYQDYIPRALATKTKYEFYRLLERFICSLKDGHTLMRYFNEVFPHYKRLTFNNGTVKILPTNINKRVFITRVGTKEMTGSFPLGTEILEVNGLPVKQYLEEYVFPYIAASTEHITWDLGVGEMFRGLIDLQDVPEWNVKFKKPDGTIFVERLKLSDGPEGNWYPGYEEFRDVEFKWLDNQIAYLAINTFIRDTVVSIVKSLLPQLKNARGVIIDLRENGGGNSNIGAAVLGYFTDDDTLIGSRWKTRTSTAFFKANGYFLRKKTGLDETENKYLLNYKNNLWLEGGLMKFYNNSSVTDRLRMPLVILTGHKTASAAEDFLIMLDGLGGRAITIGQRTNGSTGQPLFAGIPTGGSYQVCVKKDTYPDGRPFVGIGIIPTIEIDPSIEDVLAGKDVVLMKAVEYLRKNK